MKQLIISLDFGANGLLNEHFKTEVAQVTLSDTAAALLEQGESLAHLPGSQGDVKLSLSQNVPLPIPVVGLMLQEHLVESIELRIADLP